MICPKCHSNNVNVQISSETQLVTKHHGVIWWLLLGWWWVLVKWFVFTVPALILKLFRPARYQANTISHSNCVCQSCGYHWTIK